MKSYNGQCGRADTAVIANIQHFSIHDGPGIRTTVFFKGCNLHCSWCHNPETIDPGTEIGFDSEKCIGCGRCAVCPRGLHIFDGNIHIFKRDGCMGCGRCAEACPADALTVYGKRMDLPEMIEECVRDSRVFPDFGGVTFSGGECLLQADQTAAAARELKKQGIHICIDTALNVSWETVQKVLPVTDLFLLDLKAGSAHVHKTYTGADGKRIAENINRLSALAEYWIRIPVIHGVNDTENELRQMADFIKGLKTLPQRIQLLEYHALGEHKYRKLGRTMEKFSAPEEPERGRMMEYFESTGVRTEWN